MLTSTFLFDFIHWRMLLLLPLSCFKHLSSVLACRCAAQDAHVRLCFCFISHRKQSASCLSTYLQGRVFIIVSVQATEKCILRYCELRVCVCVFVCVCVCVCVCYACACIVRPVCKNPCLFIYYCEYFLVCLSALLPPSLFLPV